MTADEVSDDELMLMLRTPEDNLKKQRARSRRASPSPASDASDVSDDELLSILGRQPSTKTSPVAPPYSLTDYAGEAKKLPRTPDPRFNGVQAPRITDGERIAMAQEERERDLDAEGVTGLAREFAVTGREKGAAHRLPPHGDPLTGMITTGILGAGAGAAVGPMLAGVPAGAASGFTQAFTGGATEPRDLLTATVAGAGTSALLNRAARPARAPSSQAEMDAAALQAAGPRRRDLPEGQHGTNQLATEADARLNAAVVAREKAQGEAIAEAEGEQALQTLGKQFPTSRAISDIGKVREQGTGTQGPMNQRGDARLRDVQLQLTKPLEGPDGPQIGKPGTEALSFPELRRLQVGVNKRLELTDDRMARVGDEQAARVVSEATRGTDPRLGPGNFGGALDRYGAEQDALRNVEELRGPPTGRVSKLATTGRADASSGPAALEQESQVRRLQEAEPAANDLIAQIRARGVRGRRGLQMPSYMGGSPTMGAVRALRSNLDNLRFHLDRPRIDAAGNVAAQAPSRAGDLALPLELQLLLRQKMYSDEQEQP